jgi:hypothetical protein
MAFFAIFRVAWRKMVRRPDQAAHLFLQLEAIEHRTTRCRPQSNGFVDRLHRMLNGTLYS